MITLGELIRDARLRAGISQRELVRRLQLADKNAVSRYEANRRRPDPAPGRTLERLCRELSLPYEMCCLLMDAPPPYPGAYKQYLAVNLLMRRLPAEIVEDIERVVMLPEKHRARILRVFRDGLALYEEKQRLTLP